MHIVYIYMKFVNSCLLINKQPVIISCQIQTSNIPYFIKFDIVKSNILCKKVFLFRLC